MFLVTGKYPEILVDFAKPAINMAVQGGKGQLFDVPSKVL